jgi:glutamyl-tRNA synthetase
VPLHLQLFAALEFPQVAYAHIAPLMKQIPGGKRKLSKRKDDEASVDFYLQAGYPAKAVQYYLRGLANGRLAELPLAEALAEPIRLEECGVAGPLVDMAKLEDISADHIATLAAQDVYDAVLAWALAYDAELAGVLEAEPELALRAIDVERGGDNPRKDLRKWSDFRPAYGFFFPQLFAFTPELLTPLGVAPGVVEALLGDLTDSYDHEREEWFGQIRDLAAKHGFARNAKELKSDPERFPGSIREASQLVRVALTGSTRSPDLHAVSRALGADEVRARLRAAAG